MTATNPAYVIRKALAEDEAAIQAMVRSERLNPHGLYFQNFAVAARDDELIGATQIRHHRDGSRELGSVVVRPSWRGRGISAVIISSLLQNEKGDVYTITRKAHAGHYTRWGFAAVPPRMAPRAIRFNYRVGSVIGATMAVLQRRKINRLVILKRPAAAVP